MTWMPNRRALIAGLGATLAALTTGGRSLRAQSTLGGNGPARHELDRWMDELPTKHRIFVDTASRQGGQDGVQFAGNLFNINESAYGVKPADVAVIICFRHQSTAYGYNDAMWAKYRAVLLAATRTAEDRDREPRQPASPTRGRRAHGCHACRQGRRHRGLLASHSRNGRPDRHGNGRIAGDHSQRAHGEPCPQRSLRPGGRRRGDTRAGVRLQIA